MNDTISVYVPDGHKVKVHTDYGGYIYLRTRAGLLQMSYDTVKWLDWSTVKFYEDKE